MKSLLAVSGLMLCGFAIAACMTDDPTATSDDRSSETSASDAAFTAVHVPPELTLSRPDGVVNGHEFTANACHVNLLFCADPRTDPPFDPPLPSYCSNGCTASQAFSAAESLCQSVCGHIDCSVLANFGGC